MNYYYQINAVGMPDDLKKLELIAMNDFHCDGVEEFSMDEAQVDDLLGERAYSGGDIPLSVIQEVDQNNSSKNQVRYAFYFYEEGAEEASKRFFNHLAQFKEIKAELKREEEKDWNSEWRKYYKPLKVSENLRIVPEWLKSESDGPYDVYIYPGQGFGTGTHETTFLCLCSLEKLINVGFKIHTCLDFGCGSGILGVAAIKRAGATVDFCDIDKAALDNTVQNLALNFKDQDLSGNSLIIRDRFKGDKEYDLVFANILEHILILEEDVIVRSVRKGGYLILSGLLNDQVTNIANEYGKRGLKVEEILSRGDWSQILLRKA